MGERENEGPVNAAEAKERMMAMEAQLSQVQHHHFHHHHRRCPYHNCDSITCLFPPVDWDGAQGITQQEARREENGEKSEKSDHYQENKWLNWTFTNYFDTLVN